MLIASPLGRFAALVCDVLCVCCCLLCKLCYPADRCKILSFCHPKPGKVRHSPPRPPPMCVSMRVCFDGFSCASCLTHAMRSAQSGAYCHLIFHHCVMQYHRIETHVLSFATVPTLSLTAPLPCYCCCCYPLLPRVAVFVFLGAVAARRVTSPPMTWTGRCVCSGST